MRNLSTTEYGNTRIVCGTIDGDVSRGRNEVEVPGLSVEKPVLRATIALRTGSEDTWATYVLELLGFERIAFMATDTFAAGADAVLAIDFAG